MVKLWIRPISENGDMSYKEAEVKVMMWQGKGNTLVEKPIRGSQVNSTMS